MKQCTKFHEGIVVSEKLENVCEKVWRTDEQTEKLYTQQKLVGYKNIVS